MMKSLLIPFFIVSSIIPASASQTTKCNIYYNNMGKVFADVPCRVQTNGGRLMRVNVYFPHVNRWYDWGVGMPGISPDKRWKECIRHTSAEGNQYQVCIK